MKDEDFYYEEEILSPAAFRNQDEEEWQIGYQEQYNDYEGSVF